MTTILPQAGFVVWLTGLPNTGKSTAAQALRTLLAKRGISALILDTDELRSVLLPNSTNLPDEQAWLYEVITNWTAWLVQQGQNVLIAAVGNERHNRDILRHKVPHFVEVHLLCNEETLQEREGRYIYSPLAVPYEPPLAPELTIDTSDTFPDDVAYKIFIHLRHEGVFG